MAKTDSEREVRAEVERLEREIARLKKAVKNKKFGLVWIDVPEEFEEESRNAMPVLKEVPEKAVVNDDGKPTHILIEGDNYHALTCLNYTHKRKIDVIYIDPPFNTGSQTWRYNNNYVEADDPFKHSKWLSMMKKRLDLAKRLLKRDGAIIVAIDDYEVHQLGLLLSDIFGDYERDLIVVEHHPQGAGSNTVSRTHEYAFVCTPKDVGLQGRKMQEKEGRWSLKRAGQGENNWRVNRPKQFFAMLIDESKRRVVGVGPEIPKEERDYPRGKTPDGYLRVYPIDRDNKERVWRYNRGTMSGLIRANKIEYTAKGSLVVKKSSVDALPVFSVWQGSRYNAGAHGSSLLTRIMGKANLFPYPKSLYTVVDMVNLIVRQKREASVLDFFAGSGTTAHAVMEMNKEDGGSRQCILCTNNENNICEEVTFPRVERVMNGYPFEGKEKEVLYEKKLNLTALKKVGEIVEEIEAIKTMEGEKYEKYEVKVQDNHVRLIGTKKVAGKKDGLGGSLKYYKTAFIGKNNVINASDSDKVELAHQAGELLALAENTLYKVKENKYWQLYEKAERYTAIYFREELDHFEEFVGMVEKLEWPVTVYMFSWGDDEFGDEFEHIEGVRVKTIPLPILEIYKSIYSLG